MNTMNEQTDPIVEQIERAEAEVRTLARKLVAARKRLADAKSARKAAIITDAESIHARVAKRFEVSDAYVKKVRQEAGWTKSAD